MEIAQLSVRGQELDLECERLVANVGAHKKNAGGKFGSSRVITRIGRQGYGSAGCVV